MAEWQIFRNFIDDNQIVMNKFKPLDQFFPTDASASCHTAKVRKILKSRSSILERLQDFASSVPDFRRSDKGNIRHRLSDIIMLMILGRTSGKVGRADIIAYGRHNISKFRKMGMLKNGVPSEATLCRVENGINSAHMADRMQQFIELFHRELREAACDNEIICVDGKAQRGTVQENGRNPDIVSAYSYNTGLTLATEACQEKSNEIKAVPLLIAKIGICGKIMTADAMSMQKSIVDCVRTHGGDFVIELKANQRSFRYMVEDRLKWLTPVYEYTEGPELGHGRIETRTYRVYDGLGLIADKEKWGGNLTIVEYISDTVRKSTGEYTTEKRLYASNLPANTPFLGAYIRNHWSIESHHWCLDHNLLQDKVKRKYANAARNLDTIQRIVCSVFSIWKGRRKKKSDKRKGMTELMRHVAMSFTKLIQILSQK